MSETREIEPVYYELIYGSVLQGIAQGIDREAVEAYVDENWPRASLTTKRAVYLDAYKDALKQGVEREDIDPSWF